MSTLQTVIFPKDSFTLNQAITWLRDNGFKFHKVDEKKNTYRFRQTNPVYPAQYYTKKLDNGVDLVFFDTD